jgi:large subunit ribosomal protein L11
MAKKIKAQVKIQLPAGRATPAPPVGPTLAQYGINMGQFIKDFNAKTADKMGMIIPTIITVYTDRTYSFVLKTPPAANLLLKAAGIEKGSAEPNKIKVGKITKSQLREIAETKLPDLNAYDIEAAMKIIAGTAKNMGIEIVEG